MNLPNCFLNIWAKNLSFHKGSVLYILKTKQNRKNSSTVELQFPVSGTYSKHRIHGELIRIWPTPVVKDNLPHHNSSPLGEYTQDVPKEGLTLSKTNLRSSTSTGALRGWCLSSVDFGNICATVMSF